MSGLHRIVLFSSVLLLAACARSPSEAEYTQWSEALVAMGHLRTERAPADAPFSNEDLVRNFREIFFYNEEIRDGHVLVQEHGPKLLEKHTGPVTYKVGGDGARYEDERNADLVAERIARATGLTVRHTENEKVADINVWILSHEGRRSVANTIDALYDSEAAASLSADLRNDLPGVTCVAYPYSRKDDPDALLYIIVIPDEVTGLLRKSCIEEEIGQAFGPSADYALARPSVFNDDQEFALLTAHDEMLLRILHDPRLSAGMSEAEAMPIVRQIVAELRPYGVQ